jgi:hypothetical protein
LLLPVNVIDPESGHLNGSKTQVEQTEGHGVIASTLARPAVKRRQELTPLNLIKDLRKSLATEIRDRRHRQHQGRWALASQMHEAQELSQDRERVVNAFWTEDATAWCGITPQIVCSDSIPAQRPISKLPRQIVIEDTEWGRSGTVRERPIHPLKMLIGIKPPLPSWARNRFAKPASEPEPLEKSGLSGPAGCDFPARQAFTHDQGDISPPQLCCATPSLSEIPGDLSNKPAVVMDREICRVTFVEIFGKPFVDEIKIGF